MAQAINKSKTDYPIRIGRRWDWRIVSTIEKIRRFTIPALYIALFLACSGLRLLNTGAIEEVRRFGDSADYTEKASWPLWSWGRHTGPLGGMITWWLQGRPPTVPLFYKMAGNVPRKIAILQLSFSILSWGLLALAVSRAIQFSWLKPFAFLIILLFSLSDHIIMWDTAILSDSISLSLMALFIASWVWLLEDWRWQKAALMLAVAFLWAFARDSDAWVLLMLAALLVLIGSLWRSQRCLSVVPVLVMFFIANEVSENYAQRNFWAFFSVIGRRILPNAESTAFFAQLGMPVTPALMRLSGKSAGAQDKAFYKDPALQAFREWAYDRGKSSYMRFLLAHPVMTIREPLKDIETFIAPELTAKTSYYSYSSFSPILTGTLAGVIYFQKFALFLLWVWACGPMFVFGFLIAVQRGELRWLVPLVLIILAYPHVVLVWHGDVDDFGRHALQAAVHLRLGMWMLFFFVADTILVHTTNGRIRRLIAGTAKRN